MQPNDRQLVDLVRELPAAELAPEQIETLWQRFVDSPELRDELLRGASGPNYVREAFGRLDLPVDAYLSGSPPDEGAGASTSAAPATGSSSKAADPPILVHMSWLPMVPFVLAILLFVVIGLLISVYHLRWGEPQVAVRSQSSAVNTTEPSEAVLDPRDGLPPTDKTPSGANTDPPQSDRSGDPATTRGVSPQSIQEGGPNPRATELTESAENETGGTTSAAPSDDTSSADAEAAPLLIISNEQSHPLAIELNKEGYNVWAELKASLDERAYSDVLRTMRLTPHGAQLGLLPDPVDEDLLLPFRSLIAGATRDHPELLDEMRAEFGPVAQVRLAAATAESDVPGVESVTIQFYGTEAAAGAHRWLGDRALAGGSFRKAIQHYRRALASGFTGLEADLNARLRLAGAMLGLDLGRPVMKPVELGDTHISASDFEAMVEQQRARQADPAAGSPDLFSSPTEVPPAPAPAPYKLRRWGSMPVGSRGWTKFDGDAWRFSSDFDWTAWCLSAAAAGRFVIVSNRLQVAGLDFVTGQQKWLQEFGDPRGFPQTWNWIPMRPLVIGDRIYTRRVPRMTGPELVCLDRATGRVLWTARPGDQVASQPVWHRGALVAVTASSTMPTFPAALPRVRERGKDRVFQLHLTSFDPTSGEVLGQIPWVHLRDHWYGALPCRATTAGDDLLVTAGGIVLYANLEGEIRWLRRQPYLTKKGETPPHDRYHGPPIWDENRIFTFQPGASAVECLETETGRRIWQQELPGMRRVVGLAGGHLIVNADSQLTALRCDDGTVAWQHEPDGLTQAYLCGGPGSVAYVDRGTLPSGDWRLDLVWLDPQTGDVVQRHRLTEFTHRGRSAFIPQAGPFFRIAERLLLGISEQHPRPNDREFYELVPGVFLGLHRHIQQIDNRIRLNLKTSDEVRRRMEALRERTDADSITEVIRRALTVYETLLEQQDQGNEVIVRTGNGDRPVLLIP